MILQPFVNFLAAHLWMMWVIAVAVLLSMWLFGRMIGRDRRKDFTCHRCGSTNTSITLVTETVFEFKLRLNPRSSEIRTRTCKEKGCGASQVLNQDADLLTKPA